MEEPPAPQGDPPNALPLQCVLKEDECSNLHWQDVTDKIGASQNSRLLFLTVSIQHYNKNLEIFLYRFD